MATLVTNVWVSGHGWFGPAYAAAGNPPPGTVTNAACWAAGDVPAAEASPGDETEPDTHPGSHDDGDDGEDISTTEVTEEPPPRSGKGSGDAVWTAYARAHGVTVTDDMTRAAVIAACEAAGIPT